MIHTHTHTHIYMYVCMEDSRSRVREFSERRLDPQVCGHISKDEIKEALKKMTNGKEEGPD